MRPATASTPGASLAPSIAAPSVSAPSAAPSVVAPSASAPAASSPTSTASTSSSPAPVSAVDKMISDRVEQFFVDENIAALYGKDQVDVLRCKMIDLCKRTHISTPGDYSAIENRFKFLREKVLPERRNVLRHYINVRRQESEIRKYELEPGKVDLLPFMTQTRQQIPFDTSRVGWIAGIDGYGDKKGPYLSSAFGGTAAAVAAIEDQDDPIIHTSMPSKSYRNLVFDTREKVMDDLRVNDERLRAFLDEGGRDITDEEAKAVRRRNEAWNRVSNLGEFVGDKVHRLSNWATRGIMSESKASDDSRFKAYSAKQKELLANMLWQLGPSPKDHAFYLKAMQRVNEALAGSSDLMDQATFARLQSLFTEEIKKEEGVNAKELEAFNKRMQELNDGMLKGLDKHVKDEDAMWKYRLFQMFLILTPIGGFSLMGNVFSYIDPFAQLVGPIFDGSTSLSHAVGSLASSDLLGPFGDIGHALGIDSATEYLMNNIPIVNDFCDIFDAVTGLPGVQQFFGTVSPLLSSPLLPLGIAGVYSLFRTANEVDHAVDVSKFLKAQDDLLNAEVEKFGKTRDEGPTGLKVRTLDFVKRRHQVMKDANLDVVTVGKIRNMATGADAAVELAIFKDIKFKVKNIDASGVETVEEKELSELKGDELSERRLLSMLIDPDNARVKQVTMNKTLLYSAVREAGKSAADNVAAFQVKVADDKAAKTLCDQEKTKIERDFIARFAKDYGVGTHYTDPKAAHENLEAKIIEAEHNRVYQMAKSRIPDPAAESPRASKLSGHSPLYSVAATSAAATTAARAATIKPAGHRMRHLARSATPIVGGTGVVA